MPCYAQRTTGDADNPDDRILQQERGAGEEKGTELDSALSRPLPQFDLPAESSPVAFSGPTHLSPLNSPLDMIATGTDVKPLECLLFMRNSASFRTQMTPVMEARARIR